MASATFILEELGPRRLSVSTTTPQGLDVAEAAVQAGSCAGAGGKLEGLQSSAGGMSRL